MSVIAAALKHMLAANMPHDAILAAVEDMERGLQTDEQAERRRAADRERQRLKRLRKSAESADKSDGPRVGVTRVEDKTSKLEIEPQEESKKRANALSPEFEEFWIAFPNKVGKPKARAAFPTAVRRAKGADAIMAGLRVYIAAKPADRPWLNPATFLNQERWADQPAPMARAGPAPVVGKDSVANAARRRLEEMENGSRQSGFDDHQQVAGLISGNHIRLVG